MTDLFSSDAAGWLQARPCEEAGRYQTKFATHHLGNVFIRSLHGGVTGAMIELSAEAATRSEVGQDADLAITSSSVDYLRITKDEDLHTRATIQRISRRMSVVDVTCWQDSEDLIVARGVVTLRIMTSEVAKR